MVYTGLFRAHLQGVKQLEEIEHLFKYLLTTTRTRNIPQCSPVLANYTLEQSLGAFLPSEKVNGTREERSHSLERTPNFV